MNCPAPNGNQEPRDDDVAKSLLEIAREHGKSIISLLLEIQREKAAQEKSLPFLEKLQCLRLPENTTSWGGIEGSTPYLSRVLINAFDCRNYIALSWTWEASRDEDTLRGNFFVQRRGMRYWQSPEPSGVRDCVLYRITRYMRVIGVNLLWIDQHSIVQNMYPGCKETMACAHSTCNHKREGMQVMDQVYRLSNHPVGLLGRRIASDKELNLLAKLLLRKLTFDEGDTFKLSREGSMEEAWCVLSMLSEITADNWWQRGWIFQENYRGGIRMKLLIGHQACQEQLKRSHRHPNGQPLFGNVDGELCFKSVTFSEEATKFCLALRNAHLDLQLRLPNKKKRREAIDEILSAAGRYTLILNSSEPMTPILVRDIEKRGIKKRWDRLAITANCCQYSVRLKAEKLWHNHSLSLSVLALCLLNGEIIHNGRRPNTKAVSDMNVTTYLKESLFRRIRGPGLTFNKSCRLFNVELSESGIHTHGHIWKLGDIIDTSQFQDYDPRDSNANGAASFDQRRRLKYIARALGSLGHLDLRDEILGILEWDVWDCVDPEDWLRNSRLPGRYMYMMAVEVAGAFADGRHLRLGRLVNRDNTGREDPYMAIFVWNWERKYKIRGLNNDPAYAFAASKPEGVGSYTHGANDLDRHVSFEVGIEQGYDNIPALRIRRWLPGLCFFRGRERSSVVFPWPDDLKAVCP